MWLTRLRLRSAKTIPTLIGLVPKGKFRKPKSMHEHQCGSRRPIEDTQFKATWQEAKGPVLYDGE